jgi:hypothetical protein
LFNAAYSRSLANNLPILIAGIREKTSPLSVKNQRDFDES